MDHSVLLCWQCRSYLPMSHRFCSQHHPHHSLFMLQTNNEMSCMDPRSFPPSRQQGLDFSTWRSVCWVFFSLKSVCHPTHPHLHVATVRFPYSTLQIQHHLISNNKPRLLWQSSPAEGVYLKGLIQQRNSFRGLPFIRKSTANTWEKKKKISCSILSSHSAANTSIHSCLQTSILRFSSLTTILF